MKIENVTAAVVVDRDWANLQGVRPFLRHYDNPQREIRGGDGSHLVLAKVLDSEDPNGLWIELHTEKHRQDPKVQRYKLLIPWNRVLTIAVTQDQEEFSQEIREIDRIGF